MRCQREGCENVLTGRQRRFCSVNCRKRDCDEQHRTKCPECDGWMSIGSEWRSERPERCVACHRRREARAYRARLEDVAEMYRKGMSTSEIAAELGYKPTSHPPEITAARRLGLITAYRYNEARREAAIRGREAARR